MRVRPPVGCGVSCIFYTSLQMILTKFARLDRSDNASLALFGTQAHMGVHNIDGVVLSLQRGLLSKDQHRFCTSGTLE